MLLPRLSLLVGLVALTACQTAPPYPDPMPDRALTVAVEEGFSTKLVDFEPHIAKQATPSWCWAACAEMILRFNGIPTDQAEIAARIHGVDAANQPKVNGASLYEVMCALNPDMPVGSFETIWASLEQQATEATEDPGSMKDQDIDIDKSRAAGALLAQLLPETGLAVEDLRNGHPSVVVLNDPEVPGQLHAYVLLSADYQVNESGGWIEGTVNFAQDVGARTGLIDVPEDDGVRGQVLASLDAERYPTQKVQLINPTDKQIEVWTSEELAERVVYVVTRLGSRKVLENYQQIATLQ